MSIGYYCSGCGRTVGALRGTTSGVAKTDHAPDCPSLPRAMPLSPDHAAAEVAALRARVELLERQVAVLNSTIERFLTRLAAPDQPRGPSIDPDRPIRDQPAKRAALEAARESKP